MCRFIETIQYQDGRFPLLERHEERFIRTQVAAWGRVVYPSLHQVIENNVHLPVDDKKYKCRLEYDENAITADISVYVRKKVEKLVMVTADDIDYSFKYADRSAINRLSNSLNENEDILIAKNGLITDTSICNVAFFNGSQWITPAKPLLQGVRRASLLDRKAIIAGDISSIGIANHFSSIRLFNAMIDWEEAIELPVEAISDW